tara:strand:+ start:2326 stop:2997 length:672 start_codon:yes stop_codon:yes gene_type:complete
MMDDNAWIWFIIYLMPITVVMWLLGMWANHEDYKKEHNIKGWSDREMNVKQLIVGTLVSTIVGFSGYMVGTYYGSISMLDNIYGNVESELDILESKLKDVNTREVEKKLEQVKQQVLNKVPSKESITDLNEQINGLNERLVMLSKELMEVHMELEMELSDLEDNAKIYVNDKFTKSEAEIKKQFGVMYDRVDVIHKELEEVSTMIDKAKETFFGKSVFKIKEK